MQKSLDTIQHPFKIKIFNIVGIERAFLTYLRAYTKTPDLVSYLMIKDRILSP